LLCTTTAVELVLEGLLLLGGVWLGEALGLEKQGLGFLWAGFVGLVGGVGLVLVF